MSEEKHTLGPWHHAAAYAAKLESEKEQLQKDLSEKDSHISRLEESVRVITDKWSSVCQENERHLELLKEANDVLRSAYQITKRLGAATNWDAFERLLKKVLDKQHKVMYPLNHPLEDKP